MLSFFCLYATSLSAASSAPHSGNVSRVVAACNCAVPWQARMTPRPRWWRMIAVGITVFAVQLMCGSGIAGTLSFNQASDVTNGLIINGTNGTYSHSPSAGVGGGGGLIVAAGSKNDYAVARAESYSPLSGTQLSASVMWFYDSSRRNPFASGDGIVLGFTRTSSMSVFNSNIYPFIGVNIFTFSNGNFGLSLHNGSTSRQSSANNGLLTSGRWYKTAFTGTLVGGQWSQVDTAVSTWDCGTDGLASPAAIPFMQASFQASSSPVFSQSQYWGVFGAEGDSGIAALDNFTITAIPVAPTNALFNVTSGTQTQTAAGYPLLSGTLPVTKTGAGTVVFDQANTYTGSTSISQGTLLVTNSAALKATPITVQSGGTLSINTPGTMQAPGLTLTGSSQLILPTATRQVVSLGSLSVDQVAGGRIDIGKGRIEIAPGGISEADLRADLIAGRGIGTFAPTNPGIVTSAANPSPLMVPVIGYNILPSGAAIVAWSAFGDVNLDGRVDLDDVIEIATAGRYDTSLPASWAQGDFDYNGVVDLDDVIAFVSGGLYDKGSYLPAPLALSGIAAAINGESLGIAAVPEPSAWVIAVAGLCCVGLRRNRPR
jgi:autotransporter-associated beta strand protein